MADPAVNIIDPRKLKRKDLLYFIGVTDDTIEAWINNGCPVVSDGKNQLFNLPELFKWKILWERGKAKESIKPNDGTDDIVEAKRKIAIQDLRAKKLENDEREGLLVNKKEMEDLFFRMGRALRDNLMSKNTVWGPQLNMVSGFEATTYLRKECEKLCNSLAYLNNISDEELAHEYHEYFMLGFNYAKGNQ